MAQARPTTHAIFTSNIILHVYTLNHAHYIRKLEFYHINFLFLNLKMYFENQNNLVGWDHHSIIIITSSRAAMLAEMFMY